MRAGVLCDRYQSGCLFVEAVNESRPDNARALIEVINEGVKQRPAFLAMGRMDEHPYGFVDNYQIIVFKYDLERQWLADHRGAAHFVDPYLYQVICTHAIADIFATSVHLAFVRPH